MYLKSLELCGVDRLVCNDIASLVKKIEEKGMGDLFSGKRILISGGAGFLGSWFIDLIFGLGAESITIIDNLSTGDVNNVNHLFNSGKVKLIKTSVEKFTPKKGYDYVIHMAARPNPDDYVNHPVETLKSSSTGTENLLETARLSDSIFLLTSTSEIYGNAQVIPTPETYWGYVNPVGPRSCYDEGKRYAEALTYAYLKQHGLDVRISRIFNTYGPRLDWRNPGYGRVIVKFIVQALENKPITVHGNGNQTRSFLYVSDNIYGHILLLENRKDLKGAIVNIGGEEEITILELAKLIRRLTKSNSDIIFLPARRDDPPRRRPDISKAKRLLGWTPNIKLEDGLLKTIEWVSLRLKKKR